MILPSKHINISESLLGLGGVLLSLLNIPKTIDQLWIEYSKVNNTPKYPAYHGFDHLLLALNYLYIIGAIDINTKGCIFNAINRT